MYSLSWLNRVTFADMLVVVCMQERKLREALHVQVDHHVTHGMRPEQRTVSVACYFVPWLWQ